MVVDGIDEGDGFLLHLDDETGDAGPEPAVRDERRDGDQQAGRRRDQGLPDASGQAVKAGPNASSDTSWAITK